MLRCEKTLSLPRVPLKSTTGNCYRLPEPLIFDERSYAFSVVLTEA
jgi:hypothetical protein